MNWEAIKDIYIQVLVRGYKIKYLGGNRYKLISYHPTGKKSWEQEYRNEQPHGKLICWYKNGQKYCEAEYKNGELHGKYKTWYEDGSNMWDLKYKNGYQII